MKAKQSPLKLKEFNIFESNVNFVPPGESEEINLEDLPVNINFDLFEPKEQSVHQILVELRLKVNTSGTQPGYKMNVLAVGVFAIPEIKKLNESTIQNLFGISSVNLMISNLRGFLMNITSYLPADKYVLPALDISELLDKKSKTIKSNS